MLLLENPLPIWMVGGGLAILTGVIFLVRRNLSSLLALVSVVFVTLLLVLLERWVVTEREEVEVALAQLLAAVQANDLPAVLTLIDPAATNVRADAETLMPKVRVKQTAAKLVEVEVDAAVEPHRATVKFLGRLDGVLRRGGQRIFFFDEVQILWIKRGDRWLVERYVAKRRGRPIEAVDRLRGARAAPATRRVAAIG